MIDFYTNPRSRGAIARWMLEEVGVPYTEHRMEWGTTIKAPAYLAINPMGKVPAIVHEGQVVTEVAAICAYLAEVFPDSELAPRSAERAAYYRWLFFGAGPVESAVTNKALGFVVPPERQRMIGYGSLEDVIGTLDNRLSESPYFAGDRFTAADVYTGSQVGFGLLFGSLPKLPAFTAYWDRVKDRPARLAAAAKDAA